jgi:hypothetical protein
MGNKTLTYTTLIGIHAVIGLLVFMLPFLARIYSVGMLIIGILYIIKKQNKNNEVLIVAAYITGAEVFLRANNGVLVYEFGKYAVMILITVGMYYGGFSRNAVPYWVYLLLLLPGVILAAFVLDSSIEDRKIISFVISGPACLGFCALYTYQRKVTYEQMNSIILALGLPIVCLVAYVILFNPTVRDVITGTDSNMRASGGFGPNQVSTILGLGIFVFVLRGILKSPSVQIAVLNFGIAAVLTFRGLVTFSRGGIFTAIAMIALLLIGLYLRTNAKAKAKLRYLLVFLGVLSAVIWTYSLMQTDGMLGNRYANKDAVGRDKESTFTGREQLASTEIEAFFANPVLGTGVGKSMEVRKEQTGVDAASHNELTRLLAEHGSLGIMILLILFFTPIFLHLDNRENFFMFPLLAFWLLTINHAAMRIAAPAFIYSLALLKVYIVPPQPKKRPLAHTSIT